MWCKMHLTVGWDYVNARGGGKAVVSQGLAQSKAVEVKENSMLKVPLDATPS